MALATAGADWLYTAVSSMSRLGTERRRGMQVISAPRIARNRFGILAVQPTDGEQPRESRLVLEKALEQAEAHSMALMQIALLESLAYQHFDHSEQAPARQAMERARGIARQFSAPAVLARFENNLGTLLVRQGFAEEARSLLLSSLTIQDRIGRRLPALHPLGGLAEAEAAAGNWRNTLVLFTATETIARSRGYLLLTDFDETEAELIRSAEGHLGPEAAAEARAVGERLTYREAVDFAFEVNGISGRRARLR